MKKLALIGLLIGLIPQTLFAYGTGISSMPLERDKNNLSTEFTGITSTGGGVGIQARYTRKIKPDMVFDGGLGVSGGERTSRFFAGMDYEIFPDYKKQPKTSLKLNFETAKEFEERQNMITFAPTVSKGFSFWGKEAYPFVSFPIGMKLDTDSKTYDSVMSMNLGVNGKIPVRGYRHLTGSVEAIVGLSNSFSGLFASVTFPLGGK